VRFRSCLLVVATSALLLGGCGGPKMAKVKGRVLFEDRPVADAAITFNPMPQSEKDLNPGRPATGFTDKDGYYELSTNRPYDGALVGKHRVTVSLDDTNPVRCKRHQEFVFDVAAGSNNLDIPLSK
jgi:hypothetical protein